MPRKRLHAIFDPLSPASPGLTSRKINIVTTKARKPIATKLQIRILLL
jgi:hypothetical protein